MKPQQRLPIALAALALLNLRAPATAQQGLPGGGNVVSGSATIRAPAAGQLTVRQDSQRAIIDWNSFSIGAGESVRFVQPSTDAAVLNRVTGATSSTIAGSLSGNGQVFLVNPNGIAITPTGSVQLGGGFVASTLDIRNEDFTAGRLSFNAHDGTIGRVANAGTVQVAPGGFVALLGDQVSNDGRISAPLGRVALGAGTQATLDLNGDGFLQVGWPGGPRATASGVDASGSVEAVGGRIELKAADARAALRSVVNVSGSLVATSVSGHDGAIVLEAGTGGSAQVSGQLDVSGQAGAGHVAISGNAVTIAGDAARIDARSAAGRGGSVSATAQDTLTLGRVAIDASGATGGGSVLLGGELRGGGTLTHARTTDVQAGASIHADALVQGTGGSIVLWSDERTAFRGLLSARGAGSGAGGSAEVSSHGVLGFDGSVDMRGASGRSGELLLDPFNVTISTGADSNHNASFTATGNSSVIKTTTLQTALASANVTVSTGSSGAQSGDITLASALTWASGNTLTLTAARDVAFNAAISATHGGGLTATAGRNVNVNSSLTGSGAAFDVNLQASTSTSGSVNLSNSTVTTNGGTFNASAAQSTASTTAVSISSSTINTSGGALTISAQHTAAGVSGNKSKAIGLSNASLQIGSGTASLTGTVTLAGAGNFADGIFATGTVTLGGTGTYSLIGTATAANASTSAIGIEFFNGSFSFGTSHTSLTGTGVRGFVSDFHETISLGSGSLTVTGTATNDSGVQFKSDNVLVNNGGTLTFSGTSALYRGLDLISGATLNVTGTATLSGTNTCASSCRDTAGVHLADGITLNSGNLSISGSALIGPGVSWVNGGTASASFSNLGAGLFSITGSSNSGIGFEFARTNSGTTAGAVTLSGSSTSGSGLALKASTALTQSSGNLIVSGASTSGLGVDQASGSTVTNAGTGTLALQAGSQGMTLAGAVGSTGGGALSLTGSSSIGQGSTGTISTSNLLLGGSTANYDLSTSGNQIGTLAGTAASLSLLSTSSLTVGTVLGTSGLTTSGAVTLRSGADITLASGASVHGSNPVIAAGSHFVNQAGSGAVVATSGRWLVYSADASGNTFGSLDSGNTALWNQTYASLAPASVTASGSRYVFAHQPTLTFSSIATSKVYGDDANSSLITRYAVSGYDAGVSHAYLADSASTAFSGAPSLSSTGAAATATVAGGPYAISIAQGTVTSTTGYALAFDGSGSLSVTPRALTVLAGNSSHVYGNTLAFVGTEFSTSGLVNGDSVSSVSLASAGASGAANVGSYAITGSSASGSGLSNYSIRYLDGSLSVTPRALTVQAGNGTHVYGSTLTFAGTEFSTSGLVNGDAVSSVNLASAGASATANVGSYAITASGASGSGLSNYSIGYLAGSLSVTPRTLYYVADASTRPVGVSNLPLNGTLVGFVNGDTMTNALSGSLRWSTTAGPGTAAGLYAIIGSGLQVRSENYVLTQAASNATALRIADSPLPAAPSLFLATARPSLRLGNDGSQPLANCGPSADGVLAINACPWVTRDDGGR